MRCRPRLTSQRPLTGQGDDERWRTESERSADRGDGAPHTKVTQQKQNSKLQGKQPGRTVAAHNAGLVQLAPRLVHESISVGERQKLGETPILTSEIANTKRSVERFRRCRSAILQTSNMRRAGAVSGRRQTRACAETRGGGGQPHTSRSHSTVTDESTGCGACGDACG